MSTDKRIKVIKLAERKRRAKARAKQNKAAAAAAARPAQDEARAAADTVTGWVDELRRQKEQSAGAASDFNDLFEDVK